MKSRKNSFGFCGGAFGDEGKGRIVDEYVHQYAKKGPVIVYRDNGGANAGHTVTLPNGSRVALHQLPSGIFTKSATVVLGKGMVIHPGDLITELAEAQQYAKEYPLANIMVDEMAVLSLDTHRAFEATLKNWQDGGKGSTGRGISPAYADVLLRHPMLARDLRNFNRDKFTQHYKLYEAFIKGLNGDLASCKVPRLASTELTAVGSLSHFLDGLEKQSLILKKMIVDVTAFLEKSWNDPKTTFVFEKAQAVGLDTRWGVYPDVTASSTTFDGIFSATEGLIHPDQITVRAGVIKATYMSSVGTRKIPTLMSGKLADRIREDAHEYGATTKRPRDIAHLDLPALKFYTQVGGMNYHVLTHMDIVYSDTPIKVCVGYTLRGKPVNYRPDQEFLLKVKPVYKEFKPWSAEKIQAARNYQDIPSPAKIFLRFIAKELGTQLLMITTGPQRNQSVKLPKTL